MVAPFGIFATTLLLTFWLWHWQWQGRAGWEIMAGQVDVGAVIYAMAAVLAERGVRVMFWALDERRKWRAKMRAEAQAEGRAEGEAAEAQRYEKWLTRVAEEKGIPLAELLRPREETQ